MGGAPQPDHRNCLLLQTARQVVIQIEGGRSLPLFLRQVEHLLRVLEKNMCACIGPVEVKEAQGRLALL